MAVDCDPNSLAAAAKCFECEDLVQSNAIQTYILAVIAGGSLDPNVLAAAAKEFQKLDAQQHQEVRNYLLCQIANA